MSKRIVVGLDPSEYSHTALKVACARAKIYDGTVVGVGIIDPVDDVRAGSPPSNPELLAWLTAQFIENKFNHNGFRLTKWFIEDLNWSFSVITLVGMNEALESLILH